MTTTIVFPEVDGYVQSNSTNYTTARNGTGSFSVSSTSGLNVGQLYSTPTYYCIESFLSFDTAFLSDTASLSSISMSLNLNSMRASGRTFELREYDFGSTITSADWIAGANIGNYTLLSQYTTTAAGWVTFPDSAAFRATTNLKTGTIHTVVHSDNFRTNTVPTGYEDISAFSSENETARVTDPYLTITWTDSSATTATIYPALDGYIYSYSATYSTARTGAGLSATEIETANYVGQQVGYYLYESFMSFDTSSLQAATAVFGASLNLYCDTYRNVPGILELRDYNFGSSITTADWIAGANISSYPLISQSNYGSGWLQFPDTAAFRTLTNLTTGTVHFVLSSSTFRTGTAPTENEHQGYRSSDYTGTSYDPYLTVVYKAVVTGTASSSLGAVTATATGSLTRFGVVSYSLGAVTATATAVVEKLGTASSALGEVTGTASGLVAVIGSASSTLGELTAAANGVVTVIGQAAGTLGAMVGTANGSSYKPGVGVGLLGGVTGTAVGTSLTIVYGYGGSVLGGILGQCVAEAQTMENVILIGGGTRNSVVASDNDAILRSAVRSGIA